MRQNKLGFCGLECSQCPAYIALQTDDNALRDKTAAEWSEKFHHAFTREMINCSGCRAKKGIQCGYCSMCSARACALKKKNQGCCSCGELESCSILTEMEAQSGFDFRKTNLALRNE